MGKTGGKTEDTIEIAQLQTTNRLSSLRLRTILLQISFTRGMCTISCYLHTSIPGQLTWSTRALGHLYTPYIQMGKLLVISLNRRVMLSQKRPDPLMVIIKQLLVWDIPQ